MSPSRSQVAALLVATAAAADGAAHLHSATGCQVDRRALSSTVIAAAAKHADACDARSLDRRIGVHAASWSVRYLCRFTDPQRVTVLRDVADMPLARPVAALQNALYADMPGIVDGRHPLDMRLTYVTEAGLVIDQLTHAHRPAAVGADDYARRCVAAHLALGTELAGFAGVRLLAPRVPLGSLHVLPDNNEHIIGDCPACWLPEQSR